ncbi:hypothetical protein GGI12_002469 [Dipsacomyces acuminosporus]|nr:hypothetical protein GGI12_002469 [Dipsacomyces acuminosporus]
MEPLRLLRGHLGKTQPPWYPGEPPLAYESVVTIDHWYCRECAHLAARKRKSRAHAKNIFYPLISDMESRNPKAFAVPDDIRRQFDGIEADIDGTFINTREDRPQRANAGPANRDFARLVNDHNEAILCYRCGLSALHGLIVRCDYCPLSWHWDCLDPPLSAAPPPRKKWMCPNHADHAMRRHHKFRKERIVDLTDAPANTRNSGAVEIIDDDPPPSQELFDPKVKYRVPSSHIRQAFADRASASRPALENRHGTISDSSGSSLAAPATSTSLAADHIPQGDGDPSPTSIAEWLQSLVMFQQDVARFVMRTAKQAALQAAAGSREMDSEDEDTVYASGKSQNSQDEKLAFLSTIAARILDPTASESSTLTKTASHNEAASSSLSETIPGTSSDEDQSLERAQLRRLRILAQHGIADSDFQEAAKLFVSRSSLQCRCCALDCHTNGGASNAICAKDSDNSSNKRKPKLCAQAPDSRLDGPQLKRIRSSLKSPSDGAQEQYGHSTAQAPKAAVLEEEPTGEAAVAGTPTADDSGSNTTASSIQASQAVDLIFALLSKKGPDALVDFLLSD